ncbi:hypothetical protein [Agromyces humi]|uniref:hypothetical protein n=1 Tax=Agromyces humi TaxID=1766800 RepID=UPI0013599A31|nr:hypothetical protein [Agromyces humi]
MEKELITAVTPDTLKDIPEDKLARFGFLVAVALGANDEGGADLVGTINTIADTILGMRVGNLTDDELNAYRELADLNGVSHDGSGGW